MDVNAKSLVWDFYEETLKKLNSYGCNILRLDAFAYYT
jgi:sucrose phosphorylase